MYLGKSAQQVNDDDLIAQYLINFIFLKLKPLFIQERFRSIRQPGRFAKMKEYWRCCPTVSLSSGTWPWLRTKRKMWNSFSSWLERDVISWWRERVNFYWRLLSNMEKVSINFASLWPTKVENVCKLIWLQFVHYYTSPLNLNDNAIHIFSFG